MPHLPKRNTIPMAGIPPPSPPSSVSSIEFIPKRAIKAIPEGGAEIEPEKIWVDLAKEERYRKRERNKLQKGKEIWHQAQNIHQGDTFMNDQSARKKPFQLVSKESLLEQRAKSTGRSLAVAVHNDSRRPEYRDS